MGKLKQVVLVIMATAVVIAFFLPWVRLKTTQATGIVSEGLALASVGAWPVGFISGLFSGGKHGMSQSISAYQIPVLANSNESTLIISLMQIFMPNVEDADKKSYLLWAIPFLAGAIALAGIFLGGNKWFGLVVGVVGIAIFAVVTYKVKSIDLDKIVMKVYTGPGLWITLWAYFGMGLVSLIDFVTQLKRPKA